MVRGWISLFVSALLLFGCATCFGGECRFFRVGCVEGVAPGNLAITSDEVGQIFVEFDTLNLHNYVIQDADWLSPSPAWETVSTVLGDGKRSKWLTTRTWSRTFGGAQSDRGASVQQTSDGGFIVAGSTDSFGAGARDVYLIKTDPRGKEEWSKAFGGTEWDWGYSVRQTRDGGFIVGGRTASFGAGYYDAYLIKTDRYGNEEWSRTFGGASEDWAESVQQTRDGGFIVAGWTLSFVAEEADLCLIKTDASGEEEWSRTFAGTDNAWGFCVQQTRDGGFIVAGMTGGFIPGAELGTHDIYLIKTDANGAEQWSRTFGGANDDLASSVQQTTDGGFIVAGWTQSFGAGGTDLYLLKTDSRGGEEWSTTFGGEGHDGAGSVVQTTEGGFVVVGSTDSFGAGEEDVYLIKTDRNGKEEWSRTLGGAQFDWAESVVQTTDGGFIVAGRSASFDAGTGDVYLIKTDRYGNAPAVPEE